MSMRVFKKDYIVLSTAEIFVTKSISQQVRIRSSFFEYFEVKTCEDTQIIYKPCDEFVKLSTAVLNEND